jgi:hypothetical protein
MQKFGPNRVTPNGSREHAGPDRAGLLRGYAEVLYGGCEGFVVAGCGQESYIKPSGKVGYHNFVEHEFKLPDERQDLITYTLEESENYDIWWTPNLSENPTRRMEERRSLPSVYGWGDLDGASDEDLAELDHLLEHGGFTVRSAGGERNLHPYIRLSEAAGPESLAEINRRIASHLHGDITPAMLNGYLRPPGTYNHKPRVLGNGKPVLVVLGDVIKGDGWNVDDLDAKLPLDPAGKKGHSSQGEQPNGDLLGLLSHLNLEHMVGLGHKIQARCPKWQWWSRCARTVDGIALKPQGQGHLY